MPLQKDRDLKLNIDGDFAITMNGDIDLNVGVDNVISNLFRRLSTPVGGYERVTRVPEGLTLLDSGVSNPVMQEVSSNMTTANAQKIARQLQVISELDDRINITNVTFEISNYNKIEYKIGYTLADNSNTYTTSYHL